MPRPRLPPARYDALQDWVHRGHHRTFALIREALRLERGETVVELGCGTGILARLFIAQGYDYWGIDPDAERVDMAQRANPQGRFRVGDAASFPGLDLPPLRRAFIHGVLHHVDDGECRRVLDAVLAVGPELLLAVTEPYRPHPLWRNPIGALVASLDEGAHVRTLDAWRALFGADLDTLATRTLWPRWPVPFLDARLRLAR